MFMGFPNYFTAEPVENAEDSPYFLCLSCAFLQGEFGDLPAPVLRGCGEESVTPPFYPLPDVETGEEMN